MTKISQIKKKWNFKNTDINESVYVIIKVLVPFCHVSWSESVHNFIAHLGNP